MKSAIHRLERLAITTNWRPKLLGAAPPRSASTSSSSAALTSGQWSSPNDRRRQCHQSYWTVTSARTAITPVARSRVWSSTFVLDDGDSDADDDSDDPNRNENDASPTATVSPDGQTVSISMTTTQKRTGKSTTTTRLYSAPLLWVNDPRYIHPSSGQRMRTLGKYAPTNAISKTELIIMDTATNTVHPNNNNSNDENGTSSIPPHLHPPPLPGSLHPRGGIYSFRQIHNADSHHTTTPEKNRRRVLVKLQWNYGEESFFDLTWLLEGGNCQEKVLTDTSSAATTTATPTTTTRVSKDIAIGATSIIPQSSKRDDDDKDNEGTSNNPSNVAIPTVEYAIIMDDDNTLLEAMQGIFEHGVVLVRDGPVFLDDKSRTSDEDHQHQQQQQFTEEQESIVGKLGKRFSGGILSHGSLYGDIFHVETKVKAENIAYTNVALPPHQDLTYYESKPFLQLLHCVNDDHETDDSRIIGGESVLVDAMAAAEELRTLTPDLFDVLCRREATFLKEREGAGMVSPKPHIVCDPTFGHVVEINWSPPFEGPLQPHPTISVEEYVQAYQAMECIVNHDQDDDDVVADTTNDGNPKTLLSPVLEQTLKDYARSYTWEYALQRGDILVFNNQRMLHGRRGFVSVGRGRRHLIGCYTESDATISQYRQLLRERTNTEGATKRPPGYGQRNAGNGCRWM